MLRRFTKRIIIALLIVAAITTVTLVISIASWVTGTRKQASARTAARMQAGGEFGKTTNQQACIDEGLKRGAKLGLLDFESQGDNEDFVLGCLRSGAPSPGFCDGVPSGFRNIFVDWTKQKCEKVNMIRPVCTGIYDMQIQFCEHSH